MYNFTVDEFDKCIEYTNLIMSNKNIKMREDLQCLKDSKLNCTSKAGPDFHLDKIIRNL